MGLSVTLYHFESEDIKIDIEARFEGEALIIDGYDIGRRVKEYWGDSDYEYTLTIQPQGVEMICRLLKVNPHDKEALLKAIAMRYNTNACFSEFRSFLDKNHIPCEGFSWT
jgi:hypothetical protein